MKKVLIVLVLFSSACHAGDFRLGFGYGHGDIDFNSSAQINLFDEKQDIGMLSYRAGYLFDSNVLIDFDVAMGTNNLLFGAADNADLSTTGFLLGYYLKPENSNFYLLPRVGYTSWDIELEEGEFLNPGEEIKVNIDGSDLILSLSAGYELSDSISLSISYRYLDFDYGEASSSLLDFNFTF